MGPGRAGAGSGRPGSGRAGGRVGVSAAVAVWGDCSSPPAPCPWSREAASRRLLVAGGWIPPHLVMVSTRTSGFSGSCAGGTRWSSPPAGDTCPALKAAFRNYPASYPGRTRPSVGGQARSRLRGRGPNPLLISRPRLLLCRPEIGRCAWILEP